LAFLLELLQFVGSGFGLAVFSAKLIAQNGWPPAGEARGFQQIFFYMLLSWFGMTLVMVSLFLGMLFPLVKLLLEAESKNKILLRR
jgi:hypothetical protein